MIRLTDMARWNTRLPAEVREFLEAGFGEDFRNVRVVIHKDGSSAGPRVGCAVAEQIHIRETFFRPDTKPGRLILSHELAHVTQKRRSSQRQQSDRIGTHELEAEADAAAMIVSQGGRFRCTLADSEPNPRQWRAAGHYYTTYLVLLAAGVNDHVARRVAFHAQMPDQVIELDATCVPVGAAGFGVIAGIACFLLATPLAPLMIGYIPAAVLLGVPIGAGFGLTLCKQQIIRIQKGLHTLTGRPVEKETEDRAAFLKATRFGSVACGLAIHAYGDSFAHRHGSKMFSPPFGHAAESHGPDLVAGQAELYTRFGLGLYKLTTEMTPSIVKRPVDEEQLEKRLREVANTKASSPNKYELAQINKLCQPLAGATGPIQINRKFYRPEFKEPVQWKKFSATYPNLAPPALLAYCIERASEWTPKA